MVQYADRNGKIKINPDSYVPVVKTGPGMISLPALCHRYVTVSKSMSDSFSKLLGDLITFGNFFFFLSHGEVCALHILPPMPMRYKMCKHNPSKSTSISACLQQFASSVAALCTFCSTHDA